MLISIYMPTHNYEDYIEESINSVINQTISNWELIIINDGSTDNTHKILEKFECHEQIRIYHQENKGLNVTNNIALRLARGNYIMRLDADDFLDENALKLLSDALINNESADLVYPDYYEVDKDGSILSVIKRKDIEKENVLDMPAHGACTMFKTSVLKSLGGYHEEFQCQDGYDIWLRFIQKHRPINLSIPLFYYRQHSVSLTKNKSRILKTRRGIKSKFIKEKSSSTPHQNTALIFASSSTNYVNNHPLKELNNQKLIDYTILNCQACESISEVVVCTPDQEIAEYAKQHKNLHVFMRETHDDTRESCLQDMIDNQFDPIINTDSIFFLNSNSPLLRDYHYKWAIDTLQIFNVDRVISVDEELKNLYSHTPFGLQPIGNGSQQIIKYEKNAIYSENGAIYLIKKESFKKPNKQLLTGHLALLPYEGVKINSDYEFWLAENILKSKKF